MRLRTDVVGALNLFGNRPGVLTQNIVQLGQALADVATVGLLQARTIRRREILAEQLQTALNSRVIIEQAKGVLAERHNVDMAEAFALLRTSARSRNRRLSDLAREIVDRAASL